MNDDHQLQKRDINQGSLKSAVEGNEQVKQKLAVHELYGFWTFISFNLEQFAVVPAV